MRPMTAPLLALTLAAISSAPALADNKFVLAGEDTDVYNLEFDGGTLEEYLEMLQEAARGQVGMIIPEAASLVRMPPVYIENIGLASAVELTNRMTPATYSVVEEGEAGEVLYTEDEQAMILLFRVPGTDTGDPSAARISSLEFPGGTIGDYVEALKDAGAQGKVALTGDPDAVRVEAMSLKDVTLESAVVLVDRIRGASASININVHDGLYMVHVQSAIAQRQFFARVWSLQGAISMGMDADTMLGAIETGIGMTENADSATISFHEPTALLIGVGDDYTLGLINEIVGTIDQSAFDQSRKASPLDEMRQVHGMLRRALQRKMRDVEYTQERLDEGRAELTAIEEERDNRPNGDGMNRRGPSPWPLQASKVSSLRARMAALHEQIDDLKFRITQLEYLIAEVEAGAAPAPTMAILMREFAPGMGDE